MHRHAIITLICAAFVLGTSGSAAAAKPKAPSTAEKSANKSAKKTVTKAFASAYKAARLLAKDPKLKKRMAKHRRTLKALKKNLDATDQLIVELKKLPKAKRAQHITDAEKLEQKKLEELESLIGDAIAEANDSQEDAKAQLELALHIIAEHAAHQRQVVHTLTE
jgi:hypothetical protein